MVLQKHDPTLPVVKPAPGKRERIAKGYDIIGNIAVIDMPEAGKRDEAMAKELMSVHPKVKTVVAKAGAVTGKYRRRRFRHVLGEHSFIADYRENGCIFRFDIRKSFFSNRLSFERSRIINEVKGGEHVLVLFAGVGPFAIEIAKAHPDTTVIGVELNNEAYRSMEENIKLNRLRNISALNADAAKLPVKLKEFADRIIVPMPTASTKFLESILFAANKRCVVHLYAFCKKDSAFDGIYNKIKEHAKEKGYRTKLLFGRQVRTYSHSDIEAVIDYLIVR
jgi:tRNA (guanine37-N1)-methyltransferase